jgi:hypothetical protein
MGSRTKGVEGEGQGFHTAFCDQTIPVQMVPFFSMIASGTGYEKDKNDTLLLK